MDKITLLLIAAAWLAWLIVRVRSHGGIVRMFVKDPNDTTWFCFICLCSAGAFIDLAAGHLLRNYVVAALFAGLILSRPLAWYVRRRRAA